jgi:hypothetical protein
VSSIGGPGPRTLATSTSPCPATTKGRRSATKVSTARWTNLRTASPALVTDSPVEVCFHLIGNIEIEVDGDAARTECKFVCALTAKEGGRRTDYWNAGRYLDEFACRDGRWAITRRVCVYDWSRSDVPSTRWWERDGAGR